MGCFLLVIKQETGGEDTALRKHDGGIVWTIARNVVAHPSASFPDMLGCILLPERIVWRRVEQIDSRSRVTFIRSIDPVELDVFVETRPK